MHNELATTTAEEPTTTIEPKTIKEQFVHPYVKIFYTDNQGKVSIEKTRLTICFTEYDDHVKYGVSFCAPCDNFVRAQGRRVARARLNGRPHHINKWPEDDDYLNLVIGDLVTNNMPSRWTGAVLDFKPIPN